MLIRPLKFVINYVTALNISLKQISASELTSTQRRWLVVVLIGIVVTGQFNWAAFERRSLGEFKECRLRWIFRHASIAWSRLLEASVAHALAHYAITKGVLVLDDSDKVRSRNTSKIAGVHKVKDKKTGGWFNGQEFVFLVLATDTVTIPVGFGFYIPDPAIKTWKDTVKEQKKQGIPAKDRAKKPEPNPKYPSKQQLALDLLKKFSTNHPSVKVQAVLADALYGNAVFMDKASKITSCSQVISQLRKNQLVRSRGKNIPLTTYFSRTPGVITTLMIRGSKEKSVTILAARLTVKSHGKKRFIIALKYEGETEYRFIVATDLTWRHKDVTRTYTLRWLIEVFFEDWKGHGGWSSLSKQQGVDGAAQGVTLSLLCDHLLILHPLQSARLKDKQPGMPVGCLVEHINAEALIDSVSHLVNAADPKKEFDKFKKALEESLPDRKSSKHLAGLDLGRMEPTPSLRYKKAA
ncbi:MAG: transposase [Legionellaceae bacterium]